MEAGVLDDRIKAVANIDGWPYGIAFSSDATLTQPFLQIENGSMQEVDQMVSRITLDKADGPAYRINVKDAWHENFWDFPFFFKIYSRLGYWSSMDVERLLEIVSAYTTGFFDRHLKEIPVRILNAPATDTPELVFEPRLVEPDQ